MYIVQALHHPMLGYCNPMTMHLTANVPFRCGWFINIHIIFWARIKILFKLFLRMKCIKIRQTKNCKLQQTICIQTCTLCVHDADHAVSESFVRSRVTVELFKHVCLVRWFGKWKRKWIKWIKRNNWNLISNWRVYANFVSRRCLRRVSLSFLHFRFHSTIEWIRVKT